MTIDELIKHVEEIADSYEYNASRYDMNDPFERYLARQYSKDVEEHRQLAKWLRELKKVINNDSSSI